MKPQLYGILLFKQWKTTITFLEKRLWMQRWKKKEEEEEEELERILMRLMRTRQVGGTYSCLSDGPWQVVFFYVTLL